MAPNGHRPRNGEENKSSYCCTVVIWLKNVEDSRQPEREEERKRKTSKLCVCTCHGPHGCGCEREKRETGLLDDKDWRIE